MRLVVQRVARASVTAAGVELGAIARGAVVLIGVASNDSPDVADRMADKLLGLRYFADDGGRTNLALAEAGGSYLVVSQFTLYADVRRGRRPGFSDAARPELAEVLIDRFVARLRGSGSPVVSGRFGASMEVALVNEGPFTLVLDSERDLGPGRHDARVG